jgi:hypothetical protein
MSKRVIAAGVLALLLVLGVSAKERIFTLPRAFHAKTYPAHDSHENEKFSIAADPYDMPDKAATVFTIDFRKDEMVPIHLIFSNDSGEAVSLADMHIRLITKKRVRIEPASTDDIYRRISKQKRRGDEPSTIQLPIPVKRRVPPSISKEAQLEVENSQFLAKAVEPKATQAGFFIFDTEGIENPLAGARLEITGIRKASGEELFYFEIPMEKYLGYKPGEQ